MEDYERSFIANMKELQKEGRDFSKLVRITLVDVMGEGPSSVLLSRLSGAVLPQPFLFARYMTRTFGAGAVSIFKAIESRAATGFEVIDILAGLGEPSPDERSVAGIKQTYLHDHRIKDELDEYRERLSEAD